MKIFTKNVLLAFLGFLNFKSAGGMVPNHPDDPINFPENHILITMNDGCIANARTDFAPDVPNWIQPHQPHPEQFVFYVRAPDLRLSGVFGQLSDLLRGHNATQHTPRSVQMHIRTFVCGYFMAGPFEVYPLQEQQGRFPPDHYIYVAVPHGQVYRALLRWLPYNKGDNVFNISYPGISPKGGRIFHPH